MLALIEGVTVMITQYSYKMQQQERDMQYKMQMDMMKRQMRTGGSDPYATNYSSELHGQDIKNEAEILSDGAGNLGASKAFSF